MMVAFYRSQARFYRRHYGLLVYAILKVIVVAGLCFWFLRSTRALLRRRITAHTWRERVKGYWNIVWM
jgi:hypothetical protein